MWARFISAHRVILNNNPYLSTSPLHSSLHLFRTHDICRGSATEPEDAPLTSVSALPSQLLHFFSSLGINSFTRRPRLRRRPRRSSADLQASVSHRLRHHDHRHRQQQRGRASVARADVGRRSPNTGTPSSRRHGGASGGGHITATATSASAKSATSTAAQHHPAWPHRGPLRQSIHPSILHPSG